MSHTVDARGLSCPEPVVRTLKKMNEEQKGVFTVLVSEQVAVENIGRLAKKHAWTPTVSAIDEYFQIELKKD